MKQILEGICLTFAMILYAIFVLPFEIIIATIKDAPDFRKTWRNRRRG